MEGVLLNAHHEIDHVDTVILKIDGCGSLQHPLHQTMNGHTTECNMVYLVIGSLDVECCKNH